MSVENPLPRGMRERVPTAPLTYYGVGGAARYFMHARGTADVAAAIAFAAARGLPLAVLGSGSNSLFADGVFEGVVLCLAGLDSWRWETPELLCAGAGVTNTEVSEIALAAGRAGAAWMFRMPGQLGATVRMNARCYGGEISQVVADVCTIDLKGRIRLRSGTELFRGYKDTLLMETPEVVISVRLRLPAEADRAELRAEMERCEADRHGKHHFDLPSCGSTFRNNYAVGRPSGRVFDELGLKGTRVGKAQISAFHANFVFNHGGATAQDVLGLAARMRSEALTRAGADLTLELQPIGCFPSETVQVCALERLGYAVPDPAGEGVWIGLASHPAQPPVQDKNAPLFASPFTALPPHPGKSAGPITISVRQLRPLAEALADEGPLLEWITTCPADADRWFPLRPLDSPTGSFVDGLWSTSVAELFLAHAAVPERYLELEVGPAGHWLALDFDGVRKRTAASAVPSASHWPGVRPFVRPLPGGGLELGAVLHAQALVPFLSADGRIRVQAALSLGPGLTFVAPQPHALGNAARAMLSPEKPDFHTPHDFLEFQLD